MLIRKELKQLKIGVGALTVKSHQFWALLYSSHDEMNHIIYNLLVFATVKL